MSGITTWSFPTRILFGVGAAAKVGEEAKRVGGTRALIVTDKGVVKAGLIGAIEEALAKAGVASAIFDDVLGNPIEKNVHDGKKAFVDHYVRTRAWEVRQYERAVTDWELSRYFEAV